MSVADLSRRDGSSRIISIELIGLEHVASYYFELFHSCKSTIFLIALLSKVFILVSNLLNPLKLYHILFSITIQLFPVTWPKSSFCNYFPFFSPNKKAEAHPLRPRIPIFLKLNLKHKLASVLSCSLSLYIRFSFHTHFVYSIVNCTSSFLRHCS